MLEAHTQDAIKLAHDIRHTKTFFVLDLGKSLILHLDVLRQREGIPEEKPQDVSRAVHNLEVGSVLLVCPRSHGIVLVLANGCVLGDGIAIPTFGAPLSGHQKIGRFSISYGHELLGEGSDVDSAVVLGIEVVLDDNTLLLAVTL